MRKIVLSSTILIFLVSCASLEKYQAQPTYPTKFDEIEIQFYESPSDIQDDFDEDSKISEIEFNMVRNLLLSSLRKHGSVGGLGEALILNQSCEVECVYAYLFEENYQNPDIYVVDDQLYDDWRVQHVEVAQDFRLDSDIFRTLWLALASYPNWSVIIQKESSVYVYVKFHEIHVAGAGAALCEKLKSCLSKMHLTKH